MKNKVTIKITSFNTEPFSAPKEYQVKLATLRTAKEIGDTETINNTQLSKLRNSGIKFDIVNY
jgi:hypothetical protein